MKTVIHRTARSAQRNSPNLLAALGVSGLISTAYLAAKAGYDSASVITAVEIDEDIEMTTKEKAEYTWKLYIPAALSAVASAGCIIASTRISARRTAAMAAAYSIGERAFADYRDKVVEEIGTGKERAIRDELAEDAVKKNPPSGSLIVESGQSLACELHTRRYFRTTMQDLKAAQNEINAKVVSNLYVTLDDLYDILGLEHTAESDQFGWDSDKLLEFDITSVLSPDGQPCIAFGYNYLKPI